MADTVDNSTTNTSSFADLPQLDTSLAPVPTDSFKTSQAPAANPYDAATPQYGVYQAYINDLGRAPENSNVLSQWSTDPNYASDIANSSEAQTLGRAKNEINPTVDSQIQEFQRQAQIAQQQAQQGLSALDPKYNQQFGALQFGLTGQQQAVNQQLADLAQNYDVTSGRLGQQLGLVPQQAFNMANRRGLLDSSIAYDTLNKLALPVQNNLADLTRAYANNRSAAQQKLQSINEKYQFDRQGLVSQREQEAQAIRNQLALAYQQSQSQASQAEATRAPQIYARSGSLGDLYKQYQLQNQQVQGYLQNLQAQQSLTQRGQDIGLQTAKLPYEMAPKK